MNPAQPPELLINSGGKDAPVVMLAHGAGAPMDTPFMTFFAEGLAAKGITCLRFEFPYMARRRTEGGKRPPDRQPVLLACWQAAIAQALPLCGGVERLIIGGKSMGGRMASLIADEVGVAGLVGLGFPFHAAGKPEKAPERCPQLATLRTPALILQGERDSLGNRESVATVPMSANIRLHWLADGDHSLKPRKASGRSEQDNLAEALAQLALFVQEVT